MADNKKILAKVFKPEMDFLIAKEYSVDDEIIDRLESLIEERRAQHAKKKAQENRYGRV